MSSDELPPIPPEAEWWEGLNGEGGAGADGAGEGRGRGEPGREGSPREAPAGSPAQAQGPLAARPGGTSAATAGRPAVSPGAEQLALLLAPRPVLGRLSAEWLRRTLTPTSPSREFMERYRGADLLEIDARCQNYLAKEALLLHPERLGDRLIALVAVRGRSWTGADPIEAFLRRCLQDGADQLSLEDALDEAQQVPGDPELADDFALAAELFGVEAPFQRLILLRFNRLPRSQRLALFAWVARGIEPGAGNPTDSKTENSASANGPTAGRATNGKGSSQVPKSADRLTLAEARRILAQVLALPQGRQS
jgi:hypothetical protein